MSTGTQRQERAAENELVFRAVNEQIVKMTDRFREQLSEIDIVCECAKSDCVSTIRINAGEFAEIGRVDGKFLVLPGHEDADAEQVAERRETYVVIVKPIVAANGNGDELR